jgi:F0F1-type ATP synthase membrane subunit b/b'
LIGQTQTALTEAEARIEETRKRAAGHVQQVASEAAADIVERLIGEKVSSADALQAVQSIRG